MARLVKQRIDLRHTHLFGTGADLRDVVAGFDLSLVDYAKIEAGSAVLHHEGGHLRLGHSDTQPVTGDTRLGHFEQGAADPVTVSDTDIAIGETVDGEILAELPVDEVVSSQVVLPIAIG